MTCRGSLHGCERSAKSASIALTCLLLRDRGLGNQGDGLRENERMIFKWLPLFPVCRLSRESRLEPFVAGLANVFHEMMHVVNCHKLLVDRNFLAAAGGGLFNGILNNAGQADREKADAKNDQWGYEKLFHRIYFGFVSWCS